MSATLIRPVGNSPNEKPALVKQYNKPYAESCIAAQISCAHSLNTLGFPSLPPELASGRCSPCSLSASVGPVTRRTYVPGPRPRLGWQLFYYPWQKQAYKQGGLFAIAWAPDKADRAVSGRRRPALSFNRSAWKGMGRPCKQCRRIGALSSVRVLFRSVLAYS